MQVPGEAVTFLNPIIMASCSVFTDVARESDI